MPRRTRAESEETRRLVLATARDLFTRDGFAAVGLERVAAEVGATRGAVYHHYASRAALLEAVVTDVQREVADQVRAAAEEAGPGLPGLEAGCRAFLDGSVADRARRVLLVDAPAALGWAAWRRIDAAHAGALLQLGLAELADVGGLADGVSVASAQAVLSGAMNDAALWVADAPDRDAALAEAWATVRTCLRALVADETAASAGSTSP